MAEQVPVAIVSVTLLVTPRGPDASSAPPASLTFDQPRIVLGRGAHADVRLPSRAVSDTHATVHVAAGGELSILDEGSTNGTGVNGQPLVQGRRKVLRSGDRIQVGEFALVIETSVAVPDPPGRTASVARQLLADAIASLGSESASPTLTLVTGRKAGRVWTFDARDRQLIAGRGDECDIVLDDADCSREHAAFTRMDDAVTVRDLGSKNGVQMGGRAAPQDRRLRDGDEVQLGRSLLTFHDPADALMRRFEQAGDERVPLAFATEPAAPASLPTSVSLPPPAVVSKPAADVPVPPVAVPTALPPAMRRNGAADWVLVVLASIILTVSVGALYVLLHGAPPSPPARPTSSHRSAATPAP